MSFHITGQQVAGGGAFSQVLDTLRFLGFFDFLLPWLFSFAIVFGLLSKFELFGKENKKISVVLALVVAFFVTGYSGPLLAGFFTSIFGGASIIIAGILVILLFIGMVGKEPKDIVKGGTLAVLVIVGVVLWLLSVGAARGVGFLPLLSPDLIAFILVFVVIAIAVWLIIRDEKPAGGGSPKKD
jgi:hypothetical protein